VISGQLAHLDGLLVVLNHHLGEHDLSATEL
jgi:hypothetical protein